MSLCVLDERWPFTYLQVYADATVDADRELVVDVMMAVGERMTGQTLGPDARPFVEAMAEQEASLLRCRPYSTFAQSISCTPHDEAERLTPPNSSSGSFAFGTLPTLPIPEGGGPRPAAEDRRPGHSQPTRLKYQRSTTTVTAMMAIASG